ncbi:hypothetical protein ACNQTB_03195 [Corynebacterium diphtheriae]
MNKSPIYQWPAAAYYRQPESKKAYQCAPQQKSQGYQNHAGVKSNAAGKRQTANSSKHAPPHSTSSNAQKQSAQRQTSYS